MTESRARLATWTPDARRSWSALSGVRISRSLRPITPLRGVRISWLIVARNSDFCRDASMAASRAVASSSSARSRSATRPTWTPTCSTIAVIMSWRYSGGADLIARTAQTSSAYETGKAIVSRASSHTEARSWKARLASWSSASVPARSSASASRSSSWM